MYIRMYSTYLDFFYKSEHSKKAAMDAKVNLGVEYIYFNIQWRTLFFFTFFSYIIAYSKQLRRYTKIFECKWKRNFAIKKKWILDTFLTNVLGNVELFRRDFGFKVCKHMTYEICILPTCGVWTLQYTVLKRVYIDFPEDKTFFIRLNPDSVADIIKRLIAEYCFRSENLRTLPRISIFWFKILRRLFPELASASRDNSSFG